MPYVMAPDGSGVVWSDDPNATYQQAAQAAQSQTGATFGDPTGMGSSQGVSNQSNATYTTPSGGPTPTVTPTPNPSGTPASTGITVGGYTNGALPSPAVNPSVSGGGINFGTPPGPQVINWGSATQGPNGGPTSLQDILRSLITQSQNQTSYGQNALIAALSGLGGYGQQTLAPQLSQTLGMSNQVLSNLPYSSTWAGSQATGAAQTQQQLIQQLLGQTTPTAQALAGNVNQGLSQSATDMLNAVGGRITNPLQQLMDQSGFQNQNPGAVQGAGLGTRAEDMLNAFGGLTQPTLQTLLGTNSTLQAGQGLFGQGLAPSTQAALNTQAMDTTAQQYNNAKQAIMTQLLQQGAAGTGGPGSTAQIVNNLGNLSIAQQQQQAQLQQQAILANQAALQQNYGLGLGAAGTQLQSQLGALGQGLGAAQGFTGLEQSAADVANQLGLGAAQTMGSLGGQYTNTLQQALQANNQLALGGAQLTGNLAQELGGLYGNQALGFTGQVNNMYGLANQLPQSYLSAYGGNLQNILSGTQGLGQLGTSGTAALSALTGPFASIAGANSGVLGALLGAGSSILGSVLGGSGGGGNTETLGLP